MQELARRAAVKNRKLTEAVEQLVAEGGHHLVDAEGMAGLELRPVDEGVVDEMVVAGIVNEKEMTRANKLVLRVQVVGGDVHLLQCSLDRNGIVAVVS